MSSASIDIGAMANNLERGPDGIWVARSRQQISYPDEGNDNCLALEADSFWFEHRSRCIQALMQRYPPPGTVFDVGGGNGYVAMGLQRAGIPVALVEPGQQGVQNARRRGISLLVCASLEDAGFLPGSLPAVGLFDVLEHIQSDLSFLRSIHDLLAPGGRVYLSVPAFQALWSVDDDYAGHYRRYHQAGLRQVLSEAGFKVLYTTYMFFMLPLPIFLVRSLPSRLGLRKQNAWDQYQQEHSSHPGLTGHVLDLLLDWELRSIRAGHRIPTGGSCLVAAEKA